MIYIIILLFLSCYFLCYKRKIKSLCILVSIFTTIFLYEIFGAFSFVLNLNSISTHGCFYLAYCISSFGSLVFIGSRHGGGEVGSFIRF